VATAFLFIRTVFRSVELSEGFSGELANNEVEFMILDGVMVILASILMTVWHPGYGFQRRWGEAAFSFRKPKETVDREEPHTSESRANEKVGHEVSEVQAATTGSPVDSHKA
jgi:hypothetical protein